MGSMFSEMLGALYFVSMHPHLMTSGGTVYIVENPKIFVTLGDPFLLAMQPTKAWDALSVTCISMKEKS